MKRHPNPLMGEINPSRIDTAQCAPMRDAPTAVRGLSRIFARPHDLNKLLPSRNEIHLNYPLRRSTLCFFAWCSHEQRQACFSAAQRSLNRRAVKTSDLKAPTYKAPCLPQVGPLRSAISPVGRAFTVRQPSPREATFRKSSDSSGTHSKKPG